MKKVFVAMLTFCDGGKPQILTALQDENCLFSQILLSIKGDWYFKFNNSAIFEKNINDNLNITYWNIGMDSFKLFNKKLKTLPKIGLTNTRQVLKLRSRLNQNIQILSEKLKEGLNKMNELKNIYKMIRDIKGDINDSRNYTKKIKIMKSKQVKIEPGIYMTTCLICTRTCHRKCYIADDDKKCDCSAMNYNRSDKNKIYCKICPKKCHWSHHKNRPYEIVDYEEEETITLDYIKEKYFNSKKDIVTKTETLKNIKAHFIEINIECMKTQSQMMNNINELHTIALNKSIFGSVEEHIDELIIVEKAEHKKGWENRIEGLLILKKQKQDFRRLYEGKNDDLFKMSEYIRESFNDDKKIEEFISKENGTKYFSENKSCKIF